MQAWEEQRSFREIVENASVITEVLSPEEIADCFDPSWHLKHVDTIFDRLGFEIEDTFLQGRMCEFVASNIVDTAVEMINAPLVHKGKVVNCMIWAKIS